MNTQEIKKATEAIKATAKEMMTMGATGTQVAEIIASKFGNAIARLIMIDIAIDLGMKEEAKKYLAQF